MRLLRVFIAGYIFLVLTLLVATVLDVAHGAPVREYYAIAFESISGVAIVALTAVLLKIEDDRDARERPHLTIVSARGWVRMAQLYVTIIVVNRGGRNVAMEEFQVESKPWARLLSPARIGPARDELVVASGDRAEFTLRLPSDTSIGPGTRVRAIPVIGEPSEATCMAVLREENVPLMWEASRLATDLLHERDGWER